MAEGGGKCDELLAVRGAFGLRVSAREGLREVPVQ